MNYRNSEMKIDQLVGYLNEDKINLSPAFQRGHVWSIGLRRRLLRNILQGKPIPAVFLYKEASGSRYSYNILDGKQRLESLILYIGNRRAEFKIDRWDRYFFNAQDRRDGHFPVKLKDQSYPAFGGLGDDLVRDFREYAIPTIEITLDDASSLDEVISLFVDINQQGVPVSRFHIVKAMYQNDPLLKAVFGLISRQEKRGQDIFYKAMRNDFTHVLKVLQIVEGTQESNRRVERMWERLTEIALFAMTSTHRKPSEILKGFISGKHPGKFSLDKDAKRKLRRAFQFLNTAYGRSRLGKSRLATDQTHFYTLATSTITNDFQAKYGQADAIRRLAKLGQIIDGGVAPIALRGKIKEYQELSQKQTTDATRRLDRGRLLIEIVDAL